MYWGVYERTRAEAFSKAKNHPQALRHIFVRARRIFLIHQDQLSAEAFVFRRKSGG
jgi:hypothetical protein